MKFTSDLMKYPMTLALKSTVTRRQSEPVDAAERAAQAAHHQAAEAATTIAADSGTKPAKRYDSNALQAAFLGANLNRSVTVFLMNGIKRIGWLRQYDPFTVLLEGPDGVTSLTFKHTISTLRPANRT